MVVIVFRSRVREGVDEELGRVGERMYELASSMPGFVSYKDFVAEDGENVTVIEYHIQVCTPVRDYRFDA